MSINNNQQPLRGGVIHLNEPFSDCLNLNDKAMAEMQLPNGKVVKISKNAEVDLTRYGNLTINNTPVIKNRKYLPSSTQGSGKVKIEEVEKAKSEKSDEALKEEEIQELKENILGRIHSTTGGREEVTEKLTELLQQDNYKIGQLKLMESGKVDGKLFQVPVQGIDVAIANDKFTVRHEVAVRFRDFDDPDDETKVSYAKYKVVTSGAISDLTSKDPKQQDRIRQDLYYTNETKSKDASWKGRYSFWSGEGRTTLFE